MSPPICQFYFFNLPDNYPDTGGYIEVLNSNPHIPEFPLTIVDGFAGGGVYTDPRDNSLYEGSPLKLIRAAEAGIAAVNIKRHKSLTLQAEYFFIEKKKSNHEYLKQYLSEQGFASRFGKDIFLLDGEFTAWLDKIIRHIMGTVRGRNRRCLFFLDQYGYKDVPFRDIRAIFSKLTNAEIILTFASDALINYLSEDPRNLKLLQQMELGKELNIKELLENKKDNKDWRRLIQLQLHNAIRQQNETGYYTPFFIVSKKSHRTFWLVHLSNHPKARDVMTQLHWDEKNDFSHYGGPGLWMFGYDPKRDERIIRMGDLFRETEFSFDETAERKTRESIIEELPRFIHRYSDGIPVQDLYRRVANTTPATFEHIKEIAKILLQAKELEVQGPKGKHRLKRITDGDILRLPRQKTFFPISDLLNIK
uniref:Three-Cys-motif partner protein n=1 Tax=Candidatus Kentrum sp. TUN TaxID=2126343 RepID=A0A450ZN68_9GAMM|nr:MAG: three-Cys-motif partner protein [Candidatus Kentron sp. TUN]VFK55249.1 MAG: three-Cys-motif partner protein [Candidatus Kentron sp. TUN]